MSDGKGKKVVKKGGFFSFRTMITATLIKFLYVIGMLIITLAGVYIIAQPFINGPNIVGPLIEKAQGAMREQGVPSLKEAAATVAPATAPAPSQDPPSNDARDTEEAVIRIIAGLALIILGNIFWRIQCELLIILFSVHEILGSMEAELKAKD